MSSRNIRLIISYDGTAYAGWQLQPRVPTVQGAIEQVLQQMTQRPCRLRAAGRTDAGVHAAGQLATFFTDSSIGCERFLRGLNSLLPEAISIHRVEDVPLEFDPRRDNQGKHYRYSIWNAPVIPPSQRRFVHRVYGRLDLAAMADAAQRLVGRHDFAAFRAADCERKSTVRTLFRCTISAEAPLVLIDVEGTAFLKNMVRIIAGTLVAVGRGKLAPAIIDELLLCGDRTRAGITAPAHGLCMMQVLL